MSMIKIKMKRSAIGRDNRQREALKCMGFTKINQVREFKDSPIIRRALVKFSHLLELVA